MVLKDDGSTKAGILTVLAVVAAFALGYSAHAGGFRFTVDQQTQTPVSK